MAKIEAKTVPTAQSPKAFIEALDHPVRQRDALFLLDWFSTITGLQPRMWGPSIIGFGRYHYRYDTGHEGDSLMTGFSPRKAHLVFYIMPGYADLDEPLSRLGKYKIGKSCLYINKLDDVDLSVLEEIVRFGLARVRERYQTFDE